ncbi:MAG: dTDP-4-dehydrorhamnose 3,5-epimerase [Spirochaetota bacterium]|nr:dTDP-4-dehydrorhamnose 3,5-epimerase [Spirochaetota bacterium]
MAFHIISSHLNGLFVIKPDIYQDERGFFMESFHSEKFAALGFPSEFLQDNHSRSAKGVVRGLHFQWDPPQGKLMRVTRGAAYCVAVDIRKGSPSFGQWYGLELSDENKLMIWGGAGYARGFCSLVDETEVQYKCTDNYNAKGESGILWNDPSVAIAWPIENCLLSQKDSQAQTLSEWFKTPESEHFKYSP